MKKIKNSKKTKLTALVLCAIALTGCKNTVTEEIDSNTAIVNEVDMNENEYNNEDKGRNKIDYSITNQIISIRYRNIGDYEEVEENMYTQINEAIKEKSIDTLFIENIDDQIDFSKIDLSSIKMLWIEEPGNNFDYTPFYNSTYSYLSIEIGQNTNTEKTTEFLKKLKLSNALVEIDFNENEDSILQNLYLDALTNLKDLNKLEISSNIVESLDLTKVKPNELTLITEITSLVIDYSFDINKEVKCLVFAPFYPEEFEEIPVLNNITISSENKNMLIYAFILKEWDTGFKVSLSQDTKISIPENAIICFNGLNIDELSDEEFNIFSHLDYVYITNQDNFQKYFKYDASNMTLEEAIQNYRTSIEEKSLKFQ